MGKTYMNDGSWGVIRALVGTCYIHLKNNQLLVMEGDEGVKEGEQLFILKNGKMVAMFQIDDVFQFYKLDI